MANYLTTEEKDEITKLKSELLQANSMKEIMFYEREMHFILDLAEKRYYTDPKRNIRERFDSNDKSNYIETVGIPILDSTGSFAKNISYSKQRDE